MTVRGTVPPRLRAWLVALSAVTAACGCSTADEAKPIRASAQAEARVLHYTGGPATARPLPAPTTPQNPFMAPNGRSCMHVDSFTSNAYEWPGPRGVLPRVQSNSLGWLGGECAMAAFDPRGRVVTVCMKLRKPRLLLLDPSTLKELARYPLPHRDTPVVRLRKMVDDTSGGVYFYLDEQSRAVVGTSAGTVEIIAITDTPDGPRFESVRSIDVQAALARPDADSDRITSVMPDWNGRLWITGRYGTVATVTREGEDLHFIHLAGEEIENSFSTAPDGVYIVSDHALYRFEAAPDGTPTVVWRQEYDRGTRRKVGQIDQGSGTTPTLLGDRYVAIADNAEPRMHVLVYRRAKDVQGSRLVCAVPVFERGRSATENTFIGYGRSLIVENNAGYDMFLTMRGGRTSAPGVARVDVREDGSGCDLVWQADVASQTTVPKLSTATGLVYLYTKLRNAPGSIDAYYFTALDFRTGAVVYRTLTGTGLRFDNNWAAISLGPDGSAYVGVLNGMLRIADR